MKDTFYFSHDYNARSDEKIIKLLKKYGMAGYGIFWSIVECLYNNDNDLVLDYDSIAYELHIADNDIIRSIINDFDLFIIKDGSFGSASIEKRLTERDKISQRAREKAFKRWHKCESNANVSENDATALENDATALPQQQKRMQERKGKEIKEIKENIYNSRKNDFYEKVFSEEHVKLYKEKNLHEFYVFWTQENGDRRMLFETTPDFDLEKELSGLKVKAVPKRSIIPPSLELVEEYCQERKNSIDSQYFIDYYTARGWKTGKDKMVDWQAAVRTWEKNRDKYENNKPDNKRRIEAHNSDWD